MTFLQSPLVRTDERYTATEGQKYVHYRRTEVQSLLKDRSTLTTEGQNYVHLESEVDRGEELPEDRRTGLNGDGGVAEMALGNESMPCSVG